MVEEDQLLLLLLLLLRVRTNSDVLLLPWSQKENDFLACHSLLGGVVVDDHDQKESNEENEATDR